MRKQFRTNGAIGALLDEYEKALNELKTVLNSINDAQLVRIMDGKTSDPGCRSIQTILSHVVSSGYNYAIVVRKHQGETLDYRPKIQLDSTIAYQTALDEMFAFNVQLFEDYPDLKLEEHEASKKIRTRWGQLYDVEQLMEHAIVHILRHRRQIERFIAA